MFWPLSKSKSIKRKPSASTDVETMVFRDREIQVRRQPRKRNLSLSLRPDGRIRVTAPKSASRTVIESFLIMQNGWLENNLSRFSQLRSCYPVREYREGEEFPMLGRSLTLSFRAGTTARFDLDGDRLIAEIPAGEWASFNPAAPHHELGPRLRALYMEVGKQLLRSRMKIYSERMDLEPSALRFGSQRTRWGSCSWNRTISLNWRLVVAPIEVVDYIVVHELSHLKHYNHSPKFWALVAQYMPDYKTHSRWLSLNQYEGDFLAKRSELYG